MATFRILDQAPVYWLPDGTLNAGGELWFYQTNLTTPQNTWADPEKTTLNSNPVLLDASGRSVTDIWGDGEYGVVLKNALGVTIWTRNNVEIPGGGDAITIPALVNGYILGNDGTSLVWVPDRGVPDPTGLANYVLTSDGTGVPIWQLPEEPPEPDEPDIIVGDLDFTAGITDEPVKWYVDRNVATAPASGSHSTSIAITFEEEFEDPPMVFAQINQASICAAGLIGCCGVTSITTTGATINVDVNDDDDRAQFNIVSPVALYWMAVGLRNVP